MFTVDDILRTMEYQRATGTSDRSDEGGCFGVVGRNPRGTADAQRRALSAHRVQDEKNTLVWSILEVWNDWDTWTRSHFDMVSYRDSEDGIPTFMPFVHSRFEVALAGHIGKYSADYMESPQDQNEDTVVLAFALNAKEGTDSLNAATVLESVTRDVDTGEVVGSKVQYFLNRG